MTLHLVAMQETYRPAGAMARVRCLCPPTFPAFLPPFCLYEVFSLHMCVLPYKYHKILEMLPKLMKLRDTTGRRTVLSIILTPCLYDPIRTVPGLSVSPSVSPSVGPHPRTVSRAATEGSALATAGASAAGGVTSATTAASATSAKSGSRP